ncbi:DnaJ protein, partial [Reticulomyxa filosa]
MAKQWHPDANKSPEAKDKFSEINEAYQVLSNKEKRAQYDQFGFASNQQFGAADYRDFADMNLNDIFSKLFSQFGRGMTMEDAKSGPERGQDLQ